MCAWIVPPVGGLIEPAIAPEFYIEAIGAVELIGQAARFYLCSRQMPLEARGEPQLVVVAKIVRPIVGLPETIMQCAKCMVPQTERAPGIIDGGPWPRLVK